MLTRTLRAIAHHNGCSLMFTSNQHKEHLNKTVSPPLTANSTQREHQHNCPPILPAAPLVSPPALRLYRSTGCSSSVPASAIIFWAWRSVPPPS